MYYVPAKFEILLQNTAQYSFSEDMLQDHISHR